MFSQLRGWEWLIIVALILLLFGAKRLPDAARGLGRSLRIFKAETKGLADDTSKDASGKATDAATPDALSAPAPEALPAAGQAPPAAPAAAEAPAPERTEG